MTHVLRALHFRLLQIPFLQQFFLYSTSNHPLFPSVQEKLKKWRFSADLQQICNSGKKTGLKIGNHCRRMLPVQWGYPKFYSSPLLSESIINQQYRNLKGGFYGAFDHAVYHLSFLFYCSDRYFRDPLCPGGIQVEHTRGVLIQEGGQMIRLRSPTE